MTEKSHNNLSTPSFEEAEQLDDDFIPDDAQPLCLKCLTPCHPLQNYCHNCDSNEVINPLASYMPFVRIRFIYGAYGKMWRKIWYDKDASIMFRLFCLLSITFFAPVLLIVGLPYLFIGQIKNAKLRETITIVFWVLIFLLLIAYITGLFVSAFPLVRVY